jgi:hypothetical protein
MPEDSSASNFPGNGTATGIAVSADGPLKEISAADDKELSTVAKRFLVAEINRLLDENQQLKQFKDKYHDVDKRLAVLKETLRPFRTNELLSSACLIAGSAGVGAAPSFLSLNSYGWYVFVGVSALLVITGIAARVSAPSAVAARQPGASSK